MVMALGTILVVLSIALLVIAETFRRRGLRRAGLKELWRVPVRDTSDTGRPQAIVTLQDVEKYYGEYHALRGISAEIRQGEFFSLLGPSGCGKTTLLRAIAGFEDISSGTIRLDGRDMEGVAPNRRPTNLVFQSYAIFPASHGCRRTWASACARPR